MVKSTLSYVYSTCQCPLFQALIHFLVTALRRSLCGHPSEIHAGHFSWLNCRADRGRGPTARGLVQCKENSEDPLYRVRSYLFDNVNLLSYTQYTEVWKMWFWIQAHNIDLIPDLFDTTAFASHPLTLCLFGAYLVVKLVNVKVASWPQIIIDIGHSIYMISSVCVYHSPNGTPPTFRTARATSTAVRPLQRSSLGWLLSRIFDWGSRLVFAIFLVNVQAQYRPKLPT